MILSCCHPCTIFIINFPKIHCNDTFKSHSWVLKWMLTKYHPTQLTYIFFIFNLTTYPAHCNAVMILKYSWTFCLCWLPFIFILHTKDVLDCLVEDPQATSRAFLEIHFFFSNISILPGISILCSVSMYVIILMWIRLIWVLNTANSLVNLFNYKPDRPLGLQEFEAPRISRQ